MRKLLMALTLILLTCRSGAQNIQLHYDMGKYRGFLTSTVEMFRPDKHGSTFFFIDMDYSDGKVKGVHMAYWEIARALKFWDGPFAFHTEYNGGFGQWEEDGTNYAYQIDNSFLNGIEYSVDNEDFTRGFTLQALHKYIQGKHNMAFQLTGVWYVNLLKGKVLFTGFTDFWREDMNFDGEVTKFVFQAEPQLWYNFNPHFAAGGEVEIDSNFGLYKGWMVYPTFGLKYTF
jgi:hypothetical protein